MTTVCLNILEICRNDQAKVWERYSRNAMEGAEWAVVEGEADTLLGFFGFSNGTATFEVGGGTLVVGWPLILPID